MLIPSSSMVTLSGLTRRQLFPSLMNRFRKVCARSIPRSGFTIQAHSRRSPAQGSGFAWRERDVAYFACLKLTRMVRSEKLMKLSLLTSLLLQMLIGFFRRVSAAVREVSGMLLTLFILFLTA